MEHESLVLLGNRTSCVLERERILALSFLLFPFPFAKLCKPHQHQLEASMDVLSMNQASAQFVYSIHGYFLSLVKLKSLLSMVFLNEICYCVHA
ncbi:unnamed protein product [Lathyrus oleraceus]